MPKNDKSKKAQKSSSLFGTNLQGKHLENESECYDASVRVYHETHRVAITPANYELGRVVTPNGENISAPGRFKSAPDGTAVFYTYPKRKRTRWTYRHSTAHGDVSDSDKGTRVVFNFSEDVTPEQIAEILTFEAHEMVEFFNKKGGK